MDFHEASLCFSYKNQYTRVKTGIIECSNSSTSFCIPTGDQMLRKQFDILNQPQQYIT